MSRRIFTAVLTVGLAVGACVLVSTPAQASTVTPTISAVPCPLTEAQLANGRALIASSLELLNHPALADYRNNRPSLTPVTNPLTFNPADCELALADLKKKALTAKEALARYAECVVGTVSGGRGCMAELDNLEAAARDLEVALNNLRNLCPWFVL